MRRTIATIFMLAGGIAATAALAGAGEHSRSAVGWQQAAKYHVGDLDEGSAPSADADKGAVTPVAASSPVTQDDSYYGEGLSSTSVQAAPASFATTSEAAAAIGGSGASGCTSCGGSFCDTCGCGQNWFCDAIRFEYLGWFTRGRNTPPLVTTSPQGTPAGTAGVLPDATVLYGNDKIGTDPRSGGRITWNHLLADECTWADLRFWGLEDGSETFFASSTGNPILARPFFNANTATQDALLVAFPGVATGSIRVLSKNDLIAADAWLRRNVYQDCCSKLDLFAGYMFTRLDDTLQINSTTTGTDPQDPTSFGVTAALNDSFRTQNEFHAGQIGFLYQTTLQNAWSIEALGKIALGDMRQAVIISGDRTITPGAGTPITATGGLLALPSNIGSFERHRLAFAPEVNVNLIYEINPCWRLITGYSFIYWSNVVLAGNQIDFNVNPTQVPGPVAGPAVPRVTFTRSDFWAQGISFGAEYRW